MDTQTLVSQLQMLIPGEWQWRFALYHARKGRDGMELEFGALEVDGLADMAEGLRVYLLEKVLAEREVADYSPFLPPDSVGAVADTDELLREPLYDMRKSVQNAHVYAPEDIGSGLFPAPTGYLLYGFKPDAEGNIAEDVLFLRRQNPLLQSKRATICVTKGDRVTASETPCFKFTQGVDLLLAAGGCYLFTPSVEKDLGMENRQIAICEKRLDMVAASSIVSNFDTLTTAALTPRNTRKFLDFDGEVLEFIARLGELERADFLENYGITVNVEGRMETQTDEQCEFVIDLLCCRSCHDVLGRLSTGQRITPR